MHVTEIGRHAFGYCPNLERVQLPTGLLRLEEGTFAGCDSLQEIVIPASVRVVEKKVFSRCESLLRVVFTPRTTSIALGRGMFCECSHLRFVTLPHNNVQAISAEFFFHCTSLTHLQLPVSVTEMGIDAWCGSGLQAMNSSVGDDYIPGTIMLPPQLQAIPACCFMDCKSLTHLRLPPSVQWIGEEALQGSDLRSLEIPDTVHRIGFRACLDCSSLQTVTFRSSTTTTLIMDDDIFAYCPVLSVIQIAPWLWPTLCASMHGHPAFMFQFFRQYHTQIFDFNDGWVNRNMNES